MAKSKSKFRPPKKNGAINYATKSGREWGNFAERRGNRRSRLGRLTEERVEKLLQKKNEEKELISFRKFPQYSPGDCEGKDFWVEKMIDGVMISATFGITTSLRCEQEHKLKHPNEPSILIPPEMSDERIWYRICQILKDEKTKKEASS